MKVRCWDLLTLALLPLRVLAFGNVLAVQNVLKQAHVPVRQGVVHLLSQRIFRSISVTSDLRAPPKLSTAGSLLCLSLARGNLAAAIYPNPSVVAVVPPVRNAALSASQSVELCFPRIRAHSGSQKIMAASSALADRGRSPSHVQGAAMPLLPKGGYVNCPECL